MFPMAYARTVRLRRVHRHLLSADPRQSSVAAIANRWGLMHLGRFAAAYKAVVDDTSLQTLRVAR